MEIHMRKRFEYKDLPDMKTIKNDAYKIAQQITIGQTLFMKEKGVKSEAEYKKQMASQGHIMKHTHIGWNSWDETAKGTEKIYKELTRRGSYVDRFGYCLDWVMGVPENLRHLLPMGTGLTFKNADEWAKIGQIVPVQPHLGDHMIGSLNSIENTVNALRAGVTTMGNISQYYTYEYPGIDMEKERVIKMITAIEIMGHFKNQGTIIHSNVDDGFGAQFHDLANLVGWCILERYIVEDLLGAGMSHCFGNLFSDPVLRIIFGQAMWAINKTQTPGSMAYGNTIDFGFNYERNFGALASYSLGDILVQRHNPSGHAVTVIPVTEAVRIPTAEEIIQAHMTVDMMIEKAPYFEPYINWSKISSEKDILVTCGRIFFERIMNGLDDLDVDITHPGEILAALKAIGPAQLEKNFGVGQSDKQAMRGRIPVRPTNIVSTIQHKQEHIEHHIAHLSNSLKGYNVIVGATDVHEFGKEIIKNILLKANANVYDLGSSVPVQEVVDTMKETECSTVIISTYNGIALSYARELLAAAHKKNLVIHLAMGGLLNEVKEGDQLPIDVKNELVKLGVNCDNDAENTVQLVKSFAQ